MPRKQIGEGLDHSKADDEGDHESGRSDVEFFRAGQRHNRSLDSHHTADKTVDQNKQCELPPICTQPKGYGTSASSG
jgi:hypothetical protein